jgi:hypothetical protein
MSNIYLQSVQVLSMYPKHIFWGDTRLPDLRIHSSLRSSQDVVVTTIDITLEATQGGGSANKSTKVLRLLRRDATGGTGVRNGTGAERW